MSANVLTRIVFIVWIVTVAALSVMPHTKGDGLISAKLTKSGFVMHVMAYFMGMLFCYFAYGNKYAGLSIPHTRPRKDIFFILLAGLLIFLYSIVLEVVQLYLPYRTFNVYDVVGNGVGVLLFVVGWVSCWKRGNRKEEREYVRRKEILIWKDQSFYGY